MEFKGDENVYGGLEEAHEYHNQKVHCSLRDICKKTGTKKIDFCFLYRIWVN